MTPRFEDALQYAISLHRDDVRKGTSIPYVAHLLGVCALVLADGGDEDEAVAALLHDALEDHPRETSADEIRRRFGDRVLVIVERCTDTPADYRGGPKPDWRERKQRYLDHVRGSSRDAPRGPADPAAGGSRGRSGHRVALADKLDNARAILADFRELGDALWARFNAGKADQLWYYRALVTAFREGGAAGRLLDELDAVVTDLEKAAGASVGSRAGG